MLTFWEKWEGTATQRHTNAIADITGAARYIPLFQGPSEHLCVKLNFIWNVFLLHKHFMVKLKFTVSHHGHLLQILFSIRSEKAVLFKLDYLFVVDWNGPVFVYKLFWSDLIVKVSFIAWACGDGPFALTCSHGSCAQHRQNERFLLSKPWFWMATPAFLICIFFSAYVRPPTLH